jgi:hypothetical protein
MGSLQALQALLSGSFWPFAALHQGQLCVDRGQERTMPLAVTELPDKAPDLHRSELLVVTQKLEAARKQIATSVYFYAA